MSLDVSRAAPSWQLWIGRIFRGIGYVFTRGSLIAIGGAAVVFGYIWGWSDGGDSGFLAGCRATTTDTACLYAETSGKRIRHLRSSVPKPLTSAQSGEIDVLCDDLRDNLSRRMAEHYGCDQQ